MAAKIEKTFKQNLYAISTDPCQGALCILNNLFHRNRLTVSQVSVSESVIFDHRNQGMYPPSGAETASKKKKKYYFSLNSIKHGKIRNVA